MNRNLQLLLNNINVDNGNKVNYLIKCNVLSIEDIAFEVLKSKDAKYIYSVARYIDDAPIDKLTDAIIEIGDVEYIYKFARDVKGVPIDKFADSIIKIGDAEYIYKFARDVKGVPIDKFVDSIIKTGDAEYIYRFARNVKCVPIDKLADAIIKIGEAEYIYRFARNVKDAPIDKLADAIIKIGEAEYIYKFAIDVKDAPIDKLADSIIEIGDAKYIYYFTFACDVDGASIEKLEDAVIKAGNAEYIYRFARDLKDAPIDKLADSIIKTGDAEYIYKFAIDVKDAPIDKLTDAMLLTNDTYYINKFKEDILYEKRYATLNNLLELVNDNNKKEINKHLVEFSNLFKDNRNIYRLHYVKFGGDKDISFPYIPFMLPENMTREEAFLVISYLNEQIEKDFDFYRGQWCGVTRTNNMLEQYHFKLLPKDMVDGYDVITLYTVDGDFERFKGSKFYQDYFEWFTSGVSDDCVKGIYERCGLEFLPYQFSNKAYDNPNEVKVKKRSLN